MNFRERHNPEDWHEFKQWRPEDVELDRKRSRNKTDFDRIYR